MPSSCQGTPEVFSQAKHTVRLRTEDGRYKETQGFSVFEARNGKPEELMDDERSLRSHSKPSLKPWIRITRPGQFISVSVRGREVEPDIEHPICKAECHSPDDELSWRAPASQHMTFKLAARACNVEKCKSADNAAALRKHFNMVPAKAITSMDDIQALYVGVSAIDCLPIVMVRGHGYNRVSTSSDSLDCLKLLSQSGAPLGGRDVIWLENMLIPGNIEYLRDALWNNLPHPEKRNLVRIIERENRLLEDGLNPAGAARLLPSNEWRKRKPAICRPIHDGENYDTLHYRLRWPPMAALKVPAALIKLMEDFLSMHPYDNVPLNIALAATVIYIDLENGDGSKEGFLAHCAAIAKPPEPPKLPPLGQFVLYFPHMLRYSENKHLTAFIHPARFTSINYPKDSKDDEDIKVNSNLINIHRVRQLCAQIESRFPKVHRTHRFDLIPASMPGTTMVFPQDCTNAERPSKDLFTLCCLDDIRTLGLPSYHSSDCDNCDDVGSFRNVGGPSWLFSEHVQPPSHYLSGNPGVQYWRPKRNTKFMSLTGLAKTVGPLYPNISSKYYIDNKDIMESIERRFVDSAHYVKGCDFSKGDTDVALQKDTTRSQELFRVAGYLEVPSGELWLSGTGSIEWDGKEAQIEGLKKRGMLERVMKGEMQEPAVKRPRVPERRLDGSVKAKIRDILASTAVLSRDWDAMQMYIHIDDPTVEGLQCSLSQVRSFISSIEETCRSTNTTDGTGNLDDILKLAFRVLGLEPQLTLIKSEANWAAQRKVFSRLGQTIEEAIEEIWELRSSNLKNRFKYALHCFKALAESSMVQDQVKMFREIDELLQGDFNKE